jgi:deazaflavin-dependent oxidoreductase (nitroreductase family)
MAAPRPVWLRALHRLPLWLRRHGIRGYERVLGIEWIVVTTRGRRSGRPHTVVLDVVGRDGAGGGWFVQPAAPDAAWVRNVRADPRVLVEADGRETPADAVEITGADGAEVVLRFIRTHPLYARLVVRLVGYVRDVDVRDDALRTELTSVIVFALRPRAQSERPHGGQSGHPKS